METPLIIAIVIAGTSFAFIGGWIGSTKNRTSMGAVLGCLIGPIGCLIIAVLPEAKPSSIIRVTSRHATRGRPCQFCGVLITQGNTICTACGSQI